MKQKKTNVKIVTFTVFIATFMTAIEATILSTAMPTISSLLKGGEIMSWVFSIYLLTNAMMTPIYGKLTDTIGRKPVFQIGLFFFMLGSLLCGFSTSMLQLIIFRAIQGIGAGAIMPVALTIIADIYAPEKRAKILGLNSAAWGIASVVGPLAGGFIVDTIGWHWIFFVNLPIGILLMILLQTFLIEPKHKGVSGAVDIKGSLVLMSLLLAFLYGFQTISDNGGVGILTIVCFALSVLLAFIFIQVENKAVDPVIPMFLLKNKKFVLINLLAALISGFLMGIDVYIPMWMQGLLGVKAAVGGLSLTPLSITWVIGSFLAGKLLAKRSTQVSLGSGVLIILSGAIMMAFASLNTSYLVFCLISAWIGLGMGITITVCTVNAQTTVTSDLTGVATSFNTLCRTLGQTIMISIYGVILNCQISESIANNGHGYTRAQIDDVSNHVLADKMPLEQLNDLRVILFDGLHIVFVVSVGLLVVGFLINLLIKD
ncbi:MDR family MFS transporter [Vagococcus xieshaowenii]|uniref:MFS transporter n=1 Tax=Vagococcus xieshaowenii TaxID=2562451 RepID=A0AAJ5JMD7_9ENTE|nr:MDR family MFS transporter [Vagococcus xieshaowenii]QCA28970.1 MFS transporter [Vagococcus xieshaowenii]TFZ43150.1 MFS transporter [Vagococcus xieshaowenii]